MFTFIITNTNILPILSTLKFIEQSKESTVVIIQIINQWVHVSWTFREGLVTHCGISSIAVTEQHRSAKVQQRRSRLDVEFGQPAENTNANSNETASRKSCEWFQGNPLKPCLGRSILKNVPRERVPSKELEEAGPLFA